MPPRLNVDAALCSLHTCIDDVCERPCKRKTALVQFARFTLNECSELFRRFFSAARCNHVYLKILKQVWDLKDMATVPWYESDTSNEEVKACVVETVKLYLTAEEDWLRSLPH